MQHSHKPPAEEKSYNDRLFKKGIRKYFHEARYLWLKKSIGKPGINQASVLELGCFDGKLLSYLPFQPSAYDGYDANWENGLELAKANWNLYPRYQFHYCNDISAFNPGLKTADITVCMETLEHLPIQQLNNYLLRLRDSTKNLAFITVPNEKGPLVLLKYVTKKIFLKVDEPYLFRELLHASTGNLAAVERVEYGHKGFDYEQLLDRLTAHFNILSVEPIPFSFLPAWMNFSIGIIARPLTI